MLTNQKLLVLLILTSLFLTSCGITNIDKSDKKTKIENISGEGKKLKSNGGEVNLDSNDKSVIHIGSSELPKGAPNNIK